MGYNLIKTMVLKMHFDNEHYFNDQLKNEVHEI